MVSKKTKHWNFIIGDGEIFDEKGKHCGWQDYLDIYMSAKDATRLLASLSLQIEAFLDRRGPDSKDEVYVGFLGLLDWSSDE